MGGGVGTIYEGGYPWDFMVLLSIRTQHFFADLYLVFWIGMYACYTKYKFLEDSGTSEDFKLKFTFDLSSYTKSKDTWLGIGE